MAHILPRTASWSLDDILMVPKLAVIYRIRGAPNGFSSIDLRLPFRENRNRHR